MADALRFSGMIDSGTVKRLKEKLIILSWPANKYFRKEDDFLS